MAARSAWNRFSPSDLAIYGGLVLFAGLTIYPFLNVLAVSMSDYSVYLQNPMTIIPSRLTFNAYQFVFSHPLVATCYRNTVIVTLAGTAFRLVLTTLTAFPLSRAGLRGKPVFMTLLIITMMFNGGLIPNFYLVRSLGMYNRLLALIVPAGLSAFSVILMKNFFESIPESLIEAAKMDGASELFILSRVVVPLSSAIIATLSLFFAVGLWNSYFSAIVYIRDRSLWTMQVLLREIVIESTATLANEGEMAGKFHTQNMKYAVIVVAIGPILCLYPFLQKYFVKGVMIGAVKG
jgi:putative aldouronate transport system permease protein